MSQRALRQRTRATATPARCSDARALRQAKSPLISPPTPPQFDSGDGKTVSYLVADHSIECGSKYGQSARLLASLCVLIFPVGVPIILFALLYGNREAIMERETRSGADELDSIAFLFRLYHQSYWYLPVVGASGSWRVRERY